MNNMKKIPIVKINFLLFSALLIITPFLMLMNFLQNSIGQLSRAGFDVFGIHFPYILLLIIAFLLVLFFLNLKNMNKIRWLSLAMILALFALGQATSDYYFGHHFYDLQHNWHYFAYGAFSFLAYRSFSSKPKSVNRIMWQIFIYALCISCFDEIIQVFISGRVFDLSDVAKDLWGTMIGQVVIFFLLREGKDLRPVHFMPTSFKSMFTNPFTILCLQFMYAYSLLFFSCLMTDVSLVLNVSVITIVGCLLITLAIYACRNTFAKWGILILLVALGCYVLAQSYLVSPSVKYASKQTVLFNNLPLTYFDYMIYPGGGFRAVDKKQSFNTRDKQKIDDLNPDILLVATGSDGKGGKGWDDQAVMEFSFNGTVGRPIQIIKQKTAEACKTYNRLIKDNKKVLFIIHNN
jgi:VanZ family protein